MCLLIIYVYICINSSFIFIGLRIDYPYICIGYNTIVCTVYGFKYLLEFVDMLTYLCRSLACEELSNGRAVGKNWSAKRVLFLDNTVHLVFSSWSQEGEYGVQDVEVAGEQSGTKCLQNLHHCPKSVRRDIYDYYSYVSFSSKSIILF